MPFGYNRDDSRIAGGKLNISRTYKTGTARVTDARARRQS